MTEISKIMTISTANVSPETREMLDEIVKNYADGRDPEPDLLVIAKLGYGWFVFADIEPPEHTPEDLAMCMNAARQDGCEWLCLDRDGEVLEGLPAYWDDHL